MDAIQTLRDTLKNIPLLGKEQEETAVEIPMTDFQKDLADKIVKMNDAVKVIRENIVIAQKLIDIAYYLPSLDDKNEDIKKKKEEIEQITTAMSIRPVGIEPTPGIEVKP